MTATLEQPNTIYTGRFHHGIDGSRRVMVPSKWRPKSGKAELTILPWPIGQQQYLLVLPPARWNVLLERLNEMSLPDEEAARGAEVGQDLQRVHDVVDCEASQ